MTKDTGDFRQLRSVACREYTLPRDDRASQPKRWIEENMRIGLVLEVTTSFLYGKHGIEIRICVCGSRQLSIFGQNTIKRIQKFLQIHMKIKRHKQVSRLLQSDQRQKQNHKRGNLLIQQLPYRCTKEDGLTLSHQHHSSLHTKS